jgi:hypothetical protein
MMRQFSAIRLTGAVVLAVALSGLGFVGSASAHTGEFARFNYCPTSNPEAFKCINSKTVGGKIVLGKKTVPIVHPVTLQGAYTEAPKSTGFVAKFIGATNGETLSKTSQPVPGGLAGLVNCKEIRNFLERIACEGVFENGLTGVNATLELAKPASEIRVSEVNLFSEKGTALLLPVRVHLENPLLGSTCYVGSAGSPLPWNLTTGTTAPPPPAKPITGTFGEAELIAEEEIIYTYDTVLVDNSWSAPHANGCGGPIIELILDPILDSQIGTPSAAGTNIAELRTENWIAPIGSVNAH